MKRAVSLILILSLILAIFAIPAQASAVGTGILITVSAASAISAALIGLGVMPGSDGTTFDGIVSGAADYLASLGFGDGVGIPVLKYLGPGGGIQYALQSTVMQALRSWLFDQEVVVSYSASTSFSDIVFNKYSYSVSSDFPILVRCVYSLDTSGSSTRYICYFYIISSSPGSFKLNSSTTSLYETGSFYAYSPGYTYVYGHIPDFPGLPNFYLGEFDSFSGISDYFPTLSYSDFLGSVSSSYDVTLGDVAAQDTPLADAYPDWAVDSVQVDPGGDDEDPVPYIPIGLGDTLEDVLSSSQSDVQSGVSSLETPNEGNEVNISGDVGGSITPDGGGSGDLPSGDGAVTVDDLTTMFAWLAVRIDEAVESLFPDLQVIKTYLKAIAQWHETENVKYDSMLSYFSGWDADIDTMLSSISNIDLNITTLVDHAATASDTLAAIAADVQDIRDVIADPLDADINEQEQDNKNAFLNSFSKKSQAKNITDLSGFSDGFSDWFELPDVSIGGFFDQLETGVNPWFTSETQQAISVGGGPISSGVSLMSEDPPATPYLDAWDQEVQSILNGGHDDG